MGGAHAASQGESAWVASTDSKARLVSGTPEVDGKPTLMAGVQLRMEPGWKTYWRNPGDSGVPPSFDFKGSKNLKQAELLYPAPHRIAEANGTAIGYEEEVVFPIKVTPERDGEPVTLKLAFEYGLCKELCVPNEVDLELLVSPGDGKGDALLLENALAQVPKAASPDHLPAVESVTADLNAPKPTIAIDATFPEGARGTDLFIDGGDAYVPMPKPETPPIDGKQRFLVSFGSAAEAASVKGKTLTLILVSDLGATETKWTAK
ncbi:MAG TPA: protein-disulfide reductase DsbD domain-containing protein [Methyloceanibacter sp.]|nr:protein-disulfide reductase DsbD domain-containing protein [Methyloceanibacter sp.]